MEALPRDTALIVVDVQRGFDDPALGRRNNHSAEENIARLLAAWQLAGRPVIHIRHHSREPGSPLRPGQPGAEIKDLAHPREGEPVLTKHVNSAFIGTDLEERLRGRGIATLVLVGLTTDHCVSTTACMAGNLGFRTFLVGDATATFDRVGPDGRLHPAEAGQAITLASLHGEFAIVVDTAEILRSTGGGIPGRTFACIHALRVVDEAVALAAPEPRPRGRQIEHPAARAAPRTGEPRACATKGTGCPHER